MIFETERTVDDRYVWRLSIDGSELTRALGPLTQFELAGERTISKSLKGIAHLAANIEEEKIRAYLESPPDPRDGPEYHANLAFWKETLRALGASDDRINEALNAREV